MSISGRNLLLSIWLELLYKLASDGLTKICRSPWKVISILAGQMKPKRRSGMRSVNSCFLPGQTTFVVYGAPLRNLEKTRLSCPHKVRCPFAWWFLGSKPYQQSLTTSLSPRGDVLDLLLTLKHPGVSRFCGLAQSVWVLGKIESQAPLGTLVRYPHISLPSSPSRRPPSEYSAIGHHPKK